MKICLLLMKKSKNLKNITLDVYIAYFKSAHHDKLSNFSHYCHLNNQFICKSIFDSN